MSNKDELLGILEAHGKQFLQSFDLPNIGSHGKRKAFDKTGPSSSKRAKLSEDELSSEEEWGGIQAKDSESSGGDSALETDEDEGIWARPPCFLVFLVLRRARFRTR